jgi:hypothetical protein
MAKTQEHTTSVPTTNTKQVNGKTTQGKIVQTIVKDGHLVADDHSPESTGIVR